MKRLSVIFVLLLLTSPILSQTYQLLWSDEFNGDVLDPSVWTRETGGGGWGNNELQFYTDRDTNAYIENGNLVIQALKENFGGRSYTSARLITKGKKSFLYGKIEARIKTPYGQGIWPAFWTLGENINSVGWPACGEIDILELLGHQPNVAYGTVHWSNNGTHAKFGGSYTLSGSTFDADFHTFSVVWTPTKIEWYVDNLRYHQIDITPAELSELHKEQFLLLNVAVGGNWPGFPDETTVFPQKMYVDYVRVYKDATVIPDVAITTPINNGIVTPYSDIPINAAVNYDGEIEKVEFYQGGAKIGIAYAEPYEMIWENVNPGCYNITAKAYTADGYTGTSFNVLVKAGSDCVVSPYTGHPSYIPGVIEAENFNQGANGEAYFDNTSINEGGVYRVNDDVGIQKCEDFGEGFNIGWTEAGEWLDYIIDVKETGIYNLEARVASEVTTGAFKLMLDGNDLTTTINVPNTGGWQTWETVTSSDFNLTEGVHTLRLFIESGNFNLNRLDIYHPNSQPSISIISPNGGETITSEAGFSIKWNSQKVQSVRIGYSTDGGSSWGFVTQSAESQFGVYRWNTPNIDSDECLILILDESNFSIRDTSDGFFTISPTVDVEDDITVHNFSLEQNYPNPFNPTTTIKYSIPSVISTVGRNLQDFSSTSSSRNDDVNVTLKVYDILGNEVATLVNEQKSAGNYEVTFDASGLSTGMYIYKLQAGSFSQIRKMILVK